MCEKAVEKVSENESEFTMHPLKLLPLVDLVHNHNLDFVGVLGAPREDRGEAGVLALSRYRYRFPFDEFDHFLSHLIDLVFDRGIDGWGRSEMAQVCNERRISLRKTGVSSCHGIQMTLPVRAVVGGILLWRR